jgi:hypothetical protein
MNYTKKIKIQEETYKKLEILCKSDFKEMCRYVDKVLAKNMLKQANKEEQKKEKKSV